MNQNKTENQYRIIKFFSNPVIGIAGSIASVLGIFLSIYFFLGSIVTPKLTYLIHPVKAAVFRADQSSKLVVNYEGKMLEGDITATQIAIWNDGKRPIREMEILKPLVIKTENEIPIIEAKIRKINRDVVTLKLDTSKMDSGEVKILWNILEQGDGCILQLIYKGDEQVGITASAVIEGQSEIKRQQYRWDYKNFDNRVREKQAVLYLIIPSLISSMFIFLLYNYFRSDASRRKELSSLIIFNVLGMLFSFVIIWWFILRKPLGPPFGF